MVSKVTPAPQTTASSVGGAEGRHPRAHHPHHPWPVHGGAGRPRQRDHDSVVSCDNIVRVPGSGLRPSGLWWPGAGSNRRFSGRNCLSAEVVQGRIRAQAKGFRPLPFSDSGARVGKSVSKPQPGRVLRPSPTYPQPPHIRSTQADPLSGRRRSTNTTGSEVRTALGLRHLRRATPRPSRALV
jgi:hypothetical protein